MTEDVSGALLLLAAGSALIGAAVAAAALRAPRWAVLLAVTGEAAVGAGGLAEGAWVVAAAGWGMGAFLAVQWARLERRRRRP
jgi:hypothetical protein